MKYLISFLILFSNISFADENKWTPRMSYNFNDPLIGNYTYIGVQRTLNVNSYDAIAFKLGIGGDGKKINMSYTTGSPTLSFDIGVSHIQSDTSALSKNNFALEGSVRFYVGILTAVAAKDNVYLSYGVGF